MSKVQQYAQYWTEQELEELQQEYLGPLCGDGATEFPIRKEDVIEKPKHYTHSSIETIDVIEEWKLDYHLGNVIKYLSRAKHKGNELQDLRKARWYLDRAIKNKE